MTSTNWFQGGQNYIKTHRLETLTSSRISIVENDNRSVNIITITCNVQYIYIYILYRMNYLQQFIGNRRDRLEYYISVYSVYKLTVRQLFKNLRRSIENKMKFLGGIVWWKTISRLFTYFVVPTYSLIFIRLRLIYFYHMILINIFLCRYLI
jgi:hypothetical protein